MALVITGIGDKGSLQNERVGFRVTSKGDLKYNVVFVTNFTETGFYNRSNNAYWFAPETVQLGDKVVLYTRSGTDSFQVNEDGSKTYFNYWGLGQPIFTDSEKGIVVAEVDDWALSRKF